MAVPVDHMMLLAQDYTSFSSKLRPIVGGILLCLLVPSAACELTRSYDDVPLDERACAPEHEQQAACVCDAGQQGQRRCDSQGAWGRCHCEVADTGPDSREQPDATPSDDASDTDADVFDASDTDADVFDADAADTSPDGSDANDPSCPTTRTKYVVVEGTQTPVIDGDCSEFSNVEKLPFPPPGTTEGDPANLTDNTIDCRVMWLEGSPGQVHGCCDVVDDDLKATAQPDDPPDEIIRGSDGGDDRVEVMFSCHLTGPKDSCASKIFINNLSPPTHVDRNFPDGEASDDYSANVRAAATVQGTHNDGPGDTGYVIEWVQELGFDLGGGEAKQCNFMIADEDDGEPKSHALPFGPAKTTNDPAEWGCCKFSR